MPNVVLFDNIRFFFRAIFLTVFFEGFSLQKTDEIGGLSLQSCIVKLLALEGGAFRSRSRRDAP
jgi:hypothetical protein